MTSRADDFGVQQDDDDRRRNARDDYDLGYADSGWDTQGFRRPPGPSPYANQGPQANQNPGPYNNPGPYAGPSPYASPSPMGGPATRQLQRESAPPTRRHAAPGGPGGPNGPNGPGGPNGPRGRRADRRVKVKGSWWRHWTIMKVVGVLLALGCGVVILGVVVVVVTYNQTPIPTGIEGSATDAQSVVTYANSNQVIGTFGITHRVAVTYSQLTADQHNYVIDAVLSAEDRHFFTEGGISPTGILRAAYEDVTGGDGSLQGGSTITQEFVRNYYDGIGTQQTASRKIKEIFVAIKLSRTMSKQWIITQYLNTIYLGQGSYGIDAAAETYFGKPVWDMDAAQAAVLAAIIQQPSTYPLPQYRSQLVARWHYVLTGMVSMGDLTQAQADSMTFPKMENAAPRSTGSDPWDAYVMDEVQNELESPPYNYTLSEIDNGGMKIETTLNPSLMEKMYGSVDANIKQMDEDGSVSGLSGSTFDSYMHIGAVLENPANGAILAMYPGPTQNMSVSKCNKYDCDMNTTLSREQVGSSFKPYVLSTAVSEGMNAQTSVLNGFSPLWVTPDSQPTVPSSNTAAGAQPGAYKVTNDSDASYGGLNAQLAMALSVNSAYTDLTHRATTSSVVQMAARLGVNIAAAGPPDYGSGLTDDIGQVGIALGIASLTVTEQATMLAALDDNGVYHAAHIVQQISTPTQGGGETIRKATVATHWVFSANPTLNAEEDSQVQWAMSKDDSSYGTAPNANLGTGQEIIAKTGTTNTAQSAFFIGAIPNYALAVGMFTNEQNGDVASESLNNLGALADEAGGYGGTWPADIWHTFGEEVFAPLPVEQFQPVVFTGTKWDQLSPSEQSSLQKKPKPKKHPAPGVTAPPVNSPSAYPTPTATCPPGVSNVDCAGPGGPGSTPPAGGIDSTPTPIPTNTYIGGLGADVSTPDAGHGTDATQAGAAVAGSAVALPLVLFWVRKRGRRGHRRG